ncbi:MAG: hypothetical protein ABI591_20145 [Kofleriaceae bacterium]
MKPSVLLVAVLAFAACKKQSTGTPATAGDCATVIGKAIDDAARTGVASGAGSAAPRDEVDKMSNDMIVSLAPVKAATIKACVDDKWAADALTCLAKKGSITDCDDKLTETQRAHRDELANEAANKATAGAPPACDKYANYEIKCAGAEEGARPTILDFCTRARAGNPDPTYQLIKLESGCAETATDCDSYKSCVEQKKQTTVPQ